MKRFTLIALALIGVFMPLTISRTRAADKLDKALDETSLKVINFVEKWKKAGGMETSNSQPFIRAFCEAYDLDYPDPSRSNTRLNDFVFEHSIVDPTGKGRGFADAYKKGFFILESKQSSEISKTAIVTVTRSGTPHVKTNSPGYRRGTAWRSTPMWDKAMVAAKEQAEAYVSKLPPEDGRPPILMVWDVAHVILVYEDFAQSGTYRPLLAQEEHGIYLDDLKKPHIREFLRKIWNDPYSLDPSRVRQKVTEAVADHLIEMAKSMENDGHSVDAVTDFLVRCCFTFFAEDLQYIKKNAFTRFIGRNLNNPDTLPEALTNVWRKMYTGGYCGELEIELLVFGGDFLSSAAAPVMDAEQIAILYNAANANWADVDPAILSKMLERALKPADRHRMGAYYTPPAYIERIVHYTVINKLRYEWEKAIDRAIDHLTADQHTLAVKEVDAFYERLRSIILLDPSSGCGNVLSTALSLLFDFEAEVHAALRSLGLTTQEIHSRRSVGAYQLRGIEINASAVAISKLAIIMTEMKAFVKKRGAIKPPIPIISNTHGIEKRDAIIAWDSATPILDDLGRPVMRWDGRTFSINAKKISVPDQNALVPAVHFINARPADPWPKATHVIGNPPYLGYTRIRPVLGDGYANALFRSYPNVNHDIDYVMYWVLRAGMLVRDGEFEAFGFVLTDKVKQSKNRKVLDAFMQGNPALRIAMAAPSHPWAGADVRVSMLVMDKGQGHGALLVTTEERLEDGQYHVKVEATEGVIHSNLTMHVNAEQIDSLRANASLAYRGVIPGHVGFLVTRKEAEALGLATTPDITNVVRPICRGWDLMNNSREKYAIDFWPMKEAEAMERYPAAYAWLKERVKPTWDAQESPNKRKSWHIFTGSAVNLRAALYGLPRYIATSRTAQNHDFTFLDNNIIPDSSLVVFASDDSALLAVLSSKPHIAWIQAMGGTQGSSLHSRVYVHTSVFDTFPFPNVTSSQKEQLRRLGERKENHLIRVMKENPKLKRGELVKIARMIQNGRHLEEWETELAEKGQLNALADVFAAIDNAVMPLYGLDSSASYEGITDMLKTLNRKRQAEEAQGTFRPFVKKRGQNNLNN